MPVVAIGSCSTAKSRSRSTRAEACRSVPTRAEPPDEDDQRTVGAGAPLDAIATNRTHTAKPSTNPSW
jgi:hypothetical protein